MKTLLFAVMAFLITASVVNADQFMGETFSIEKKNPQNIRNLILNINVPKEFKLLQKADPFVSIYTNDDGVINRFSITHGTNILPINQKVYSTLLFVDMTLYYCTEKQSQNSVCLTKKILFEIPLDPKLKGGNVELSYSIPEAKN